MLPTSLTERRAAAALFTLITFIFAHGITGFGTQLLSWPAINRGALLFGVGIVVIGGFLGWGSIHYSTSNEDVFSILDIFIGVQIPTDFTRLRHSTSDASRWIIYVWWVAAAWLLMFSSAIIGVVTLIAWFFSPFPELIIFITALLKLGATFNLLDIPESLVIFEVEEVLRSQIRPLFWSSKGAASIAAITLGLIYSVLPFDEGQFGFIPTVRLPIIAFTDLELLRDFPLNYLENVAIFWSQSGSTILPVIAGIWSLWFWLQTLRRLPAFVSVWSAERGVEVSDVAVQLPRRPKDMLGFPALLWIHTIIYNDVIQTYDLWYLDAVHAILWTLIVVLVVFFFTIERQREPQRPMTDAYAIPLALTVQTATVATMRGYNSLDNALFLLAVPVVVSGALITLFFTPDLISVARETDTGLRALIIVPTISIVIACVGLAPHVIPTIILYAGALVAALAGITEIITLKRFGVSSGSLILMNYTILFLLVALEEFVWHNLMTS